MTEQPPGGWDRTDDIHDVLRRLIEQVFENTGEGIRRSEIRIIIPVQRQHPIDDAGTTAPHTEVITHGHRVIIVAEMPGVDEDDIQVSLDDETIRVTAISERYRYETSARIPPVDPESLGTRYRNGILEVTLNLRQASGSGNIPSR